MVDIQLDRVKFCLEEARDLSWLQSFGEVFAVFAQNDSGNISFGADNGEEKFFIKVAGLKTTESIRTQEEAVTTLKMAMPIYEDIQHTNLIKLIKHFSLDELYIAVFKWAAGDCLFDHWNFEEYYRNPHLVPPAKRFKKMPIAKRIAAAEVLFSFLETVSKSGYVAVDFYDGSIMYDFDSDTITICDIDYFQKRPTFNDMGENFWGTKRIKAPEEYRYGDVIDEATNVYTLGALLFDSFFGNYTEMEIRQRYRMNAFVPCSFDNWELSKACYAVAQKAVLSEKSGRYTSIAAFHKDWTAALLAE